MRFAVDGWDPTYGSSAGDLDLAEPDGEVDLDVELPADGWAAIPPPEPQPAPSAVVFVDGVRRVEARVWIDDLPDAHDAADATATDASVALCASYAAGAVCCCALGAHLLSADVRRGLFAVADHAEDVTTWAGTYVAHHTRVRAGQAPAAALTADLQARLTDLEVDTSVQAVALLPEHGVDQGEAMFVVDGPLRDAAQARYLGYVKSHRQAHLPAEQHRLIGALRAAERTPLFMIGAAWRRYSWYLRLPCQPAAPWAGIVRIEAAGELPVPEVIDLANRTQLVLPRFGSAEYKDSRAPQNLYPVAGLERDLRHRLGEPRVLYRALRQSSHDRG